MKEAVDSAIGFLKLFTRSGVEITLPLSEALAAADFGKLLTTAEAVSSRALAAGWLAAAPGLEDGEQCEQVGYVARRSKQNADKTITPIVDLYSPSDQMHHPIMSVYLNDAAAVQAFEAVAGVRLNDLQRYIGKDKIQRGTDAELDAYVKKVTPFGVVFRANPKYSESEAVATKAAGKVYGISKKKFLRWAGTPSTPTSAPATPATSSQQPGPQQASQQPREPQTAAELASEYRFVHDDDGFEQLEKIREKLWPKLCDDEKRIAKGASTDCRQRLAESVQEAF